MKYFILAVFLTVVLLIYRTVDYLGAFRSVELSESAEPARKVIFKSHIGPYHKVAPVIEEVETWAREHGIDCHLSFGEYLDNPDSSEEARLKSNVGCVVAEFPSALPQGFEQKEIPAQKFVKARFQGSPAIGPLKVYPKVQTFADSHGLQLRGPVIEVYEVISSTAMNTEYFFYLR